MLDNLIEKVEGKLVALPNKEGFVWSVALIIACATFLIYMPALQNDFVGWDDNLYVYDNPNIQSIDLAFFKWVSTAIVTSNWHPLTMFSHALDYSMWGLNPWGHHLTNIILHALNALLVFILTIRLIEYKEVKRDISPKPEQSTWLNKKLLLAVATTSLLFGLHPLHVESVAWISERKDVLCAFFFLLCLITYLKYASCAGSKRTIYYIVCIFLFGFALMSKPMAVSLPIILLLIDYYPLNRFAGVGKIRNSLLWIITEKVPFVLLSLFVSAITILAQRGGTTMQLMEVHSLTERIFVAFHSISFYLYKMILPLNLAPFYPYPSNINPFIIKYLAPLIIIIAITAFCLWLLKRNRMFFVVWLYFIITLLPVLGIIQVGGQAAADRYTYLPSLGPFLLAGTGAGYMFERFTQKYNRLLILSVLILISTLLGGKTIKQIKVWRNTVTLWSHEARLYPNEYTSYNNRGVAYSDLNFYQKAIKDFDKVIALNPMYKKAYYNRGIAYSKTGKYQKAVDDFNKAIKLNFKDANIYNNRGFAYHGLGKLQNALEDFNRAIQLSPQNAEYYYNMGTVFDTAGDYQNALKNFTKAIELNPGYQRSYVNRGIVYTGMGRYQDAIEDLNIAQTLNPEDSYAFNNLGNVYFNMDKYMKAIDSYNRAIEINTQNATFYNNRGSAYYYLDDKKKAVRDYRKAIDIDPQNAYTHYKLGSVLEELGDNTEALKQYEKAASLGFKKAQDYLK